MIVNGVMTEEEITEYFLSTWPLAEILYHIFNGNLNESLSHFRARSSYFSDFDRKCRERLLIFHEYQRLIFELCAYLKKGFYFANF